MQRDAKSLLRIGLIVIFSLIIVGYGLFQAKKLIDGPTISISEPKNGETVTDSLIDIQGNAKNLVFISLDDRPIFVDQNGNFDEKMLLYPGYNIIKLEARDKFGKVTRKNLELVFRET